MNNCSFIGRLGKDPDLRYTTGGKAVATFSLAVSRDGKKDETDWIDFVAWEKSAELVAQYCHKGDMIGATGSLQQRSWEDKDGKKRSVHEVKVYRIDFCGSKKSESETGTAIRAEERTITPGFVPVEDDGELPF